MIEKSRNPQIAQITQTLKKLNGGLQLLPDVYSIGRHDGATE